MGFFGIAGVSCCRGVWHLRAEALIFGTHQGKVKCSVGVGQKHTQGPVAASFVLKRFTQKPQLFGTLSGTRKRTKINKNQGGVEKKKKISPKPPNQMNTQQPSKKTKTQKDCSQPIQTLQNPHPSLWTYSQAGGSQLISIHGGTSQSTAQRNSPLRRRERRGCWAVPSTRSQRIALGLCQRQGWDSKASRQERWHLSPLSPMGRVVSCAPIVWREECVVSDPPGGLEKLWEISQQDSLHCW